MNRIYSLLAISSLCVLGWGTATGQSTEPLVGLEHEIEAARKLMRTERKLVIAGELFLTQEESKAFWPIYQDYQAEISPIGDRKIKLITEYGEKFGSMTPEIAERMLKESFDIDSSLLKLQKSYVRKFKKVLPVIKVVRLYQIENKLNAVLEFQLAARIPLVQEAN